MTGAGTQCTQADSGDSAPLLPLDAVAKECDVGRITANTVPHVVHQLPIKLVRYQLPDLLANCLTCRLVVRKRPKVAYFPVVALDDVVHSVSFR